MIPASRDVERLLLHRIGESRIETEGVSLREAIELDQNGDDAIDRFGDRNLLACVAFVDMRGFTQQSQGRPPREVAALAAPFLETVIHVAKATGALIDKTIGDEVMLVWPDALDDIARSTLDIPRTPCFVVDCISFLSNLVLAFHRSLPDAHFTAGIGIGDVYLDRVGTDTYSEWTFYGNIINAAKRLQGCAANIAGCHHGFAIGALDCPSDSIRWAEELRLVSETPDLFEGLDLVSSEFVQSKPLAGVSRVTYVAGSVR